MKDARLALTFADVSLVPLRSRVESRAQVSTRSRFSRCIELEVPIVSANMDTVTTAPMAIAMAQLGGLGVLHRGNAPDEQVAEVVRVKRHLTHMIKDPYRVTPQTPLAEAREFGFHRGVSGLLVTGDEGRLVGILTARDLRRWSKEQTVAHLMTPFDQLVVARLGVTATDARRLMLDAGVEKLPVVDDDHRLIGLITLRDIDAGEQWPKATRDSRGRLLVAAAVGVRGDYEERTDGLVQAGVDALVLDIAHGHAEHALTVTKKLKARYPGVDVVAGNVVTPEAVRDLAEAGVDGVKCGVGPGSACTTRTVAGTGVPQWTAINDCFDEAQKLDLPICADGGIREPGDVAKAIGVGGSTVMIGGMFAGREESPGQRVRRNGRLYKVYRGMASSAAADARLSLEGRRGELEPYIPEGVEMEFELKGPVADAVQELVGGLRSAMSYSNALTIPEFWVNAKFVQITQAGRRESEPIQGDR